jgi:hypothetical protein
MRLETIYDFSFCKHRDELVYCEADKVGPIHSVGLGVFIQLAKFVAIDEDVHFAFPAHLQILAAGRVEEVPKCFIDHAATRHWSPVALDELIEFLKLVRAETQNYAPLSSHVRPSQIPPRDIGN